MRASTSCMIMINPPSWCNDNVISRVAAGGLVFAVAPVHFHSMTLVLRNCTWWYWHLPLHYCTRQLRHHHLVLTIVCTASLVSIPSSIIMLPVPAYAPLRQAVAHLSLEPNFHGITCSFKQLVVPLDILYSSASNIELTTTNYELPVSASYSDEHGYILPYLYLGINDEGGDGHYL